MNSWPPLGFERLMPAGDEPPRKKSGVAAHHTPIEDEQRPRILIVDDDQDILESLSDLIELVGDYAIDVANDADSALAAATAGAPRLAIIDVKLGTSDGIDLIAQLKNIDPTTACVVMTAYRDPQYASRALASGANEFLYKPLDPEQLSNTIARLTQAPDEDGR